jgi:NAD(P)-dependent dehydrogenase (short-subunit alcohol dehydrogenase family)
MERYQDKKVVIIGGTSGMGLATAKMLMDEGARVLVTGRSQAGLESAEKELGKDALVVSSDARALRPSSTPSTCSSSTPGSASGRLLRASPRLFTMRCSTLTPKGRFSRCRSLRRS